MKVIFLDVDGVLNSHEYYASERFTPKQEKALRNKGSRELYEDTQFDDDAVARLNVIIEETGASMVLSSCWRHGPGYLKPLLRNGVVDRFIGRTPSLLVASPYGGSERKRGDEIQRWMDDNGTPEAFVILDDDDDMVHLSDHLVLTDFADGLTDEIAAEVVKRLTA